MRARCTRRRSPSWAPASPPSCGPAGPFISCWVSACGGVQWRRRLHCSAASHCAVLMAMPTIHAGRLQRPLALLLLTLWPARLPARTPGCLLLADGPNLKAANRETAPLYNQVRWVARQQQRSRATALGASAPPSRDAPARCCVLPAPPYVGLLRAVRRVNRCLLS